MEATDRGAVNGHGGWPTCKKHNKECHPDVGGYFGGLYDNGGEPTDKDFYCPSCYAGDGYTQLRWSQRHYQNLALIRRHHEQAKADK